MKQKRKPSKLRQAPRSLAGKTQAKGLRKQARVGGLRFESYLPPDLAIWLLDQIARGVFTDPGEAVFVMLGEQRELEPHVDLRRELLRRSINESLDDPRPGISSEEMLKQMEKKPLRTRPAQWRRI